MKGTKGDCTYLIDNVSPEDAAHYEQLCKEGKHKQAKVLYPKLHEHIQHCTFCTDILGIEVTEEDLQDLEMEHGQTIALGLDQEDQPVTSVGAQYDDLGFPKCPTCRTLGRVGRNSPGSNLMYYCYNCCHTF